MMREVVNFVRVLSTRFILLGKPGLLSMHRSRKSVLIVSRLKKALEKDSVQGKVEYWLGRVYGKTVIRCLDRRRPNVRLPLP